MDTDQLLAFDRVAREGSFSRAAWALGIGQPAVSARIQALEREVGGLLFARGGRGVALTDLGASFLPFARRAIEVLDTGVDVARQSQAGHHGRVSIGVLESLSGPFLGPLIGQFHRDYPLVEVLVRAGRHEQIVELLRDGVVSLALIVWPCPEVIITELDPLLALRESVALSVAPTHQLAQGGPASLERVAAEARPFLIMRWWLSPPAPVAQLSQLVRPALNVPRAPDGAQRCRGRLLPTAAGGRVSGRRPAVGCVAGRHTPALARERPRAAGRRCPTLARRNSLCGHAPRACQQAGRASRMRHARSPHALFVEPGRLHRPHSL